MFHNKKARVQYILLVYLGYTCMVNLFHKRACFLLYGFALDTYLIRKHSVAMVLLPLLCEDNAKRNEAQGHNNICIP